jgi:hypothetical protein
MPDFGGVLYRAMPPLSDERKEWLHCLVSYDVLLADWQEQYEEAARANK